ncbi:MAG TPA: VOC family protein [Actinopolymorphaceae bacterium]
MSVVIWPRWPDPEYPQQVHLDVAVSDLDEADALVTTAGGTLLQDNAGYRIDADPAGHPFCLYRDPPKAARGTTVGRLVYDCFSPRSLASFYEGFIGAEKRLEDSPERVVVDLGDDEFPNVAFQHAQFPAPRWQPSLSRTTACGLPVHRRRRTSALPDASRQGRNEACRRAGRNPHSGHRVRRSSGSPILLLDQPRQALSRLPRQPAGFMHVVVIRFRRHPRTPARRVLSPKGSAVAGRQMLCARKRRNLPGCSHGVRRRWNWVSSFS